MHTTTEARKAYSAEPGAYSQPREETLLRKQGRAPVAGAPFTATTTKADEIDNGGVTAAQQLNRSAGTTATTVMYDAGRINRSAPPAPRSMPYSKATPEALAEELTHAELTAGGTIKLQTGYMAGYNTSYDRFNTFQALQEERPLPATAPALRKEVRVTAAIRRL